MFFRENEMLWTEMAHVRVCINIYPIFMLYFVGSTFEATTNCQQINSISCRLGWAKWQTTRAAGQKTSVRFLKNLKQFWWIDKKYILVLDVQWMEEMGQTQRRPPPINNFNRLCRQMLRKYWTGWWMTLAHPKLGEDHLLLVRALDRREIMWE